MRLTAFFCLVLTMQVAASAFGQVERVTLEVKEQPVSQVLQAIGKEFQKDFFYSDVQIDMNARISVKLKDATIGEALEKVFPGKRVRYEMQDDYVLILELSDARPQIKMVTITGTVEDETGLLLPGVNVLLKGTLTGVVTDSKGAFTLTIPEQENIVLIFSFIGMETVEATYQGRPLVVKMKEDVVEIGEAVVTALGIKRDTRALGYAISTIRGDDLTAAGVTSNPFLALYGKAAGVGIQATAAGPLGGLQIRIRGAQGLESSSNVRPLFVVDGVPIYDTESSMSSRGYDPLNSFDYGSGINDINADDIESMEILKGAKASVLYGSYGANGVVLITTKSGARTRGLGITVNYSHEWEKPFTGIDFQNEYGSGEHEYHMNYEDEEKTIRRLVESRFSFGPKFDGSPIKYFDGSTRKYNAVKDNYMSLFKTGYSNNVSVAIAGGNDKGNMRLSFGHYNYDGIMKNQSYIRNSVSFNGKITVSPFASFEITNNLYNTTANNRRPNLQQMMAYGTFNRDYDLEIAMDNYKDENGYLYSMTKFGSIEGDGWGWPAAFTEPTGFFNMIWVQNENRNTDKKLHNILSIKANLKFLPYLTLSLRGGMDYTNTEYIRKEKVKHKDEMTGLFTGGRFSFSQAKNLVQNYEGLLFFEKYFMEDRLNVFAFVGGSYRKESYQKVSVGTMGDFKYEDYYSLKNGTTWPTAYDERIAGYTKEGEALYSVLGQATVSWDYTYFLEFQARNDWVSTLPKQNRSYFYPGLSFTWNFTEKWEIPYVNFGKFRLSWADVGRPASRYYALRTYSMSSLDDPNTNVNVVTGPSDLFSGDLKPERKREVEADSTCACLNRTALRSTLPTITTPSTTRLWECRSLPRPVRPISGSTPERSGTKGWSSF